MDNLELKRFEQLIESFVVAADETREWFAETLADIPDVEERRHWAQHVAKQPLEWLARYRARRQWLEENLLNDPAVMAANEALLAGETLHIAPDPLDRELQQLIDGEDG